MKVVAALICASALVCAQGEDGTGGGGDGPPSTEAIAPDAKMLTSAYTAGQWTWIPDAGVVCGDGSTSGWAINPSPSGDRGLLLFARGQGICWTASGASGCAGTSSPATLHYSSTDFQTDETQPPSGTPFLVSGVMSRTDSTNPFRSYNFAAFGTCTGDGLTGNQVHSYGTYVVHHVGYANLTRLLADIKTAFPSPTKVVAYGTSAGALGFTFNLSRVAATWPGAETIALFDSFPQLREPYATNALENAWDAAWSFSPNIPAGCAKCKPVTGDATTGLFAFYAFNGAHRTAVVDSIGDSVISQHLAIPPGDTRLLCANNSPYNACPDCEYGVCSHPGSTYPGVYDLWRNVLAGVSPAPARVYYVGPVGSTYWLRHVITNWNTGAPLNNVQQNGVPLATWLTWFESNASGWADVAP